MFKIYNYFLFFFFLFGCVCSLYSQMAVTTGLSATQLVNNIVGPGYTISNIKMNCPFGASGGFNANNSGLGIPSGILLTTGSAIKAIGPNNSVSAGTNNGTPGDGDLDSLSNIGRPLPPAPQTRTYDACAIEFDMVPACDLFSIRFMFGSEEYQEFVGSTFNDVFGFFISGKGIPNGKVNLAQVPGTTENITVNSIHSAITFDYGFGTHPAKNQQYYVDNPYPQASPRIQYDGYTTAITSSITVIPCEPYHLKIAIADVDDAILESGVFIESGSIQCSPVVYNDIASNLHGTEGCSNGSFTFCRTGPITNSHTIPITVSGTAINGTDYVFINNSITIPAGQMCATVNLVPIPDTEYETTETVIIEYKHGSCPGMDSLILDIADPIPFDAGPNKLICSGASVPVGNNSVGGYSYTWTPTTGLSDPYIAKPTATLTNTGNNPVSYHYTVSVTTPTKCILSDSMTVVVRPAPVASFSITSACTNSPVKITDQSQAVGTGGSIQHWNWNLGNNLYDTIKNPSTAYQTPGTYSVSLRVTDNFGCINEVAKTVDIHPLPLPDFTFTNPCQSNSISFNNLSSVSSGTISTSSWNFGDATTPVNSTNPSHVFPGPGTYTVQLTVTSNQNCINTIAKPISITSAAINAGPNKIICTGDTIQIGNSPTAGYSYTWSPGAGLNNINISNPYVTLTNNTNTPAIYHYTVSASSSNGCILQDSITVIVRPNPVASFSLTGACTSSPIKITDLSQAGAGAFVRQWNWNLGNNLYDTVQHPSMVYQNAGTYSVVLTVTDNFGCTDDVSNTVDIYPFPKANFTAINVCEGGNVSFTNLSSVNSGNITTTLWKFGDGTSSPYPAATNPQHLYSLPGTYTVQVTVTTNQNCINSISKVVEVYSKPVINFKVDPVCVNALTRFFNTSTSNYFQWTFGDGNSSSLQNPEHTYTSSGTKTIKLVGTNTYGCKDSLTKTLDIRPPPIASFSLTNVCVNTPVKMTDLSIPLGTGAGIKRWNWDFGNNLFDTIQHPSTTYQNAGNYPVKLSVTDNFGCIDDTVENVTIYPAPKPNFSFQNVCEGDSVSFTNLSNVSSGQIVTSIWNFGDGSDIENVINTKHLYPPGAGTYAVQLIITTNWNCISTLSKVVEVFPKPDIDFKVDPVCVNGIVKFFNNSTADYLKWTFGDGDSSSLMNPKHIYTTPGIKIIKLIGTNSYGCKDSLTKPLEIYPKPVADFTMDADSGCAPVCVNLKDITSINNTDSIVSWQWIFNKDILFGNGNYIRCFDKDGTYSPGLIVSSSKGCTDSVFKTTTITVFPQPTAAFDLSPSVTSIYDPLITITDLSGEHILRWDFGDSKIDSLLRLIQHTYKEPGNYTITQVVRNIHGCLDSVSHPLRINPETTVFVPNAFTPDENGINDHFFPKVSGYLLDANFVMYIYDRWGNRVFESNSLSYEWNGKVNGGKDHAQQDVYNYIIIFYDKLTNEELKRLTGHVTLVR